MTRQDDGRMVVQFVDSHRRNNIPLAGLVAIGIGGVAPVRAADPPSKRCAVDLGLGLPPRTSRR